MFSVSSNLNEDSLTDDIAAFVAAVNHWNELDGGNLFDPAREVFLARAPGRLDLMGGIADYSGSLVLQYPIREATKVALQRYALPLIVVVSLPPATEEKKQEILSFSITLDEIKPGGKFADYAAAREYFSSSPTLSWAAYVVGVFLVLMHERGVSFEEGARILISSDVPEGKGVSSSAALEVATMQSVAAAYDLDLNARELALLCQKVENEVVGAPCGVMDQMTSVCGEANKLLALVCQPAELKGTIQLPEEIEIWGVDSGIRHSVAGADYGSVRAGAFMGYRMIAELAGLKVENLENNFVRVEDEKWRGYLANITTAEFEENFKAKLPEKITGAEFLRNYHGTTDKISFIDASREYAVLAPAAHPIYENDRVRKFAELLNKKPSEDQLKSLGELMYESHASYSACGLGSAGTDLLIEMVKKSGAESGLYGAKITGGGSGGTVAVLGRRGAADVVKEIAEKYARETGFIPRIFSGSSPGAAKFGFRKLKVK